MKKNFLLLVLMFLFLLQKNFSQNSEALAGPLTLKQCVDIALQNNADINRSELQMEDSKVNVTLAKGNMLPYFSGNINHGVSKGRAIDPFTNGYINQNLTYANYNLGGSIYLWSGGSVRNNILANNLNYQASRMDWQQQKDNITINVILAYLQVLNNQEQLNEARQQVEVTRNQTQRLEILNKNGAILPSDYYDNKGQLANEEISVLNYKNALETSRIELARLLNIPYSAEMELENINTENELTVYDGTSKQIYKDALENLALVKAADLRVAGADKALKSAKGQLFPSVVLNGGLGTNYSNAATVSTLTGTINVPTDNYILLNTDKVPVYAPQNTYASQKITYGDQWKNNFNSSLSVGLQIPILNGLQTRSRINQAKIEEKLTLLNAKTTKTQLQQNVEQAYLNMNNAFERYQKLSEQVKDFSESFRSAEVRFNAGVLTSVDYLIAKNNVDRANINLIAAKYDYILYIKILDFYQGRLSFQ